MGYGHGMNPFSTVFMIHRDDLSIKAGTWVVHYVCFFFTHQNPAGWLSSNSYSAYVRSSVHFNCRVLLFSMPIDSPIFIFALSTTVYMDGAFKKCELLYLLSPKTHMFYAISAHVKHVSYFKSLEIHVYTNGKSF